MAKFKVGDIVQLKSGGPKMTISYIDKDDKYYVCKWFNGKKLDDGRFTDDILIAPEEEPKK